VSRCPVCTHPFPTFDARRQANLASSRLNEGGQATGCVGPCARVETPVCTHAACVPRWSDAGHWEKVLSDAAGGAAFAPAQLPVTMCA